MEITPGIYAIREIRGIFVHAFLLDDGDGLTLIDTLHSTGAKGILSQIRHIGKMTSDLKRIVLTHAHRAHLGGLAALKEVSGADVYCHAWEADIAAGDRKPQCMSLKPTPPLILWPFQVASRFGQHPPCQVDHLLSDGDQVGPLQVVHAPGHTPGHLAFYWPERRALFTGDALVTWPEFEPGWTAFNLNIKQNTESLYKLAGLDADILAVGHGDPIASGGTERLHALLEKLEQGE